jgi:Tat protein translocase TatC
MLRFASLRILGAIPTLFLVIVVAFLMVRLAPGGPFDDERVLPPENASNLAAAYHLDETLPQQFGRYLGGLMRGDLGPSYHYRDYSVSELIARALPVSLRLGTLAMLLALLLGVSAGIAAAIKRDSLLDRVWAFVAPGLYLKEKRFAMPLLASSIVLFYAGIAFAYFVVFPLIFGFFTAIAPVTVEVQPDIAQFLDFITTIILAFGIAFEVPVATVLVVWTGLTTPEKLAKARPYVFLLAFVLGMFLTPPDFISQTLLAVPIYLLYEIGIFMSKVFVRKRDEEADEEPATAE